MNNDKVETLLGDLIVLLKSNSTAPQPVPGWISKTQLMEFLGYNDTKMWELLKSKEFHVCKIGNKKFIEVQSFLQFMTRNIVN